MIHSTPRPITPDPRATRIADLSHEYLTASPVRREAIGEEVAAIIAGRVVVIHRRKANSPATPEP